MKLEYNGFDLGQLGKVIILSTGGKAAPAEAPNRFERYLRWRINLHQSTFTENFALAEQGRAAVRRQNGTLKWTDEAGKVWVNQTAKVEDCNWPENPNAQAGGTYFQVIEGTFVYYDVLSAAEGSQVEAKYKAGADGAEVTLGRVEKLKVEQGIDRQGEYISNRDKSVTRVTMAGRFLANPATAVEARRTELLAALASMRDTVAANKDGLLTYGGLFASQFVRVDSFGADADQHQDYITWSLSCHYTNFPNEAGFAQAAFEVVSSEDKESGMTVMELRGAVASNSETQAREKWASIRANAFKDLPNYACVRSSATRDAVDGLDGEGFLRMRFEESWRKTAGDIHSQSLRIQEDASTTAGTGLKIYSGFVTATGATYDAAYNTALARAQSLGDRKGQVKLDERIEATDRLRLSQSKTKDNATAADAADAVDGLGNVAWVTLEFSYTYRTKGTRLWVELNASTATNLAGEDREEVSGFVVAADAAAMEAAYKAALDVYEGRVIRDREVNDRRDQIGEIDLGTGTVTGNKVETALRRDFRFSVFKAKAAAQICMRYQMEVMRNWKENTKTTRVMGTIWAIDANVDDTGVAGAYLTAFLATLGLTSPIQSRRVKSAEMSPKHDKANTWGATVESVNALEFEEVYESALSGSAAVLSSSLSESIKQSGTRIVVQPTASSTVKIQECGTSEGVRVLSGEVVATNETAAKDWMAMQQWYPLPAGVTATLNGSPATSGKAEPIEVEYQTVFVDMKTGIARNGTYGGFGVKAVSEVKMVRGMFRKREFYEELTGVI